MQTKEELIHDSYVAFLTKKGINNVPATLQPIVVSIQEAKELMDAWAKPGVDAMKEAKELIEWMIKNMDLNCPDRNHRSFMEHLGNGYMNTMHLIDEALKQYNK